MFYSGAYIKNYASAGVALLVNKSWKNKIHSYTFIKCLTTGWTIR
jgi:hypothetical protein